MKFELTSDRLVMQVLNSDSAELVYNFYCHNKGDFEKYEPLLGENFYSIEYHEKVLAFEHKNILSCNMIRYWIFEKNDPSKIIGTASIRNIVKPIYDSCTIGYKMDIDYRNQGYCYEALSTIIPHVTEATGIHRVEALVLPDNNPSITLLEKLGFSKEGLLKDKITLNNVRRDHYMYAYLADN